MTPNFLSLILIVLFTALCASVVFRRLHLPVIFGYLLVGVLMGPHSLGLVPNTPYINTLAHFGIVFLMFTIGLEFSLPQLFALRKVVLVFGSLQVLLTIGAVMLIGYLLQMSLLASLAIGSITAMSSTALVVKQLDEQMGLHSTSGSNAVGILLFQDLSVIPLIILIASLGQDNTQQLFLSLLWALAKGSLAIGIIFILGNKVFSPVFRLIASTRAIELFTLAVLLITLSAAWVTNMLGLSYALGAFLAGIMLGETEFRHQIQVEIRPFKDILLGLFFISIGLLADIPVWPLYAKWIVLLLTGFIIGKMLLVFLICRLFGNSSYNAIRSGILLAQGGEFGFALLTLALQKNILPPDYGQSILAALLISIAISPVLLINNRRIASWLLPLHKPLLLVPPDDANAFTPIKKHVVICGYGRVGQHLGRLLDRLEYPYLAIDLDPDLVRRAQLAGENVMFGDPARAEILHAANIEQAKALVISFDDFKATKNILGSVRHLLPQLPILVRCRDEHELQQLKASDHVHIIAELFEESLTISRRLLSIIDIPGHTITEVIREIRSTDYDLLSKVFTSEATEALASDNEPQEQLLPILIPSQAYAVNKTIAELNKRGFCIEVIALRRAHIKRFKPHPQVKICANDILIIFGLPENIEHAVRWLLKGP